MNKAQEIIEMAGKAKTFIIEMEGKDPEDAILKILRQEDTMEGASILAKKEKFVFFIDKEKRPIDELFGVIHLLLEKDPRFRDSDGPAGVFEIAQGKYLIFGRGEE